MTEPTPPNGDLTFLDRAIAEIFELPEPTRKLYAQALLDSLGDYILDGSTDQSPLVADPENIPSSEKLEERYSINAEDQDAFRIALRKKNALEFLREQGRRKVNPKLELMERRYKKAFSGRDPVKVGPALLFTYAEVLYLTNHARRVAVPSQLIEYLRS
jgi:hypothetical protein